MRKFWVATALLLLSAGAAYYATGGRFWGLTDRIVAAGDGSRPAASAEKSPATKGAGATPPAVAVEAATAVATTSTEDIRAIGTLQSDEGVQIASEIAGRVTEIPLIEGQSVEAGSILVKLDDALAVAELADASARFSLAESNLGRANSLAKSGNVTERARDEALTNQETARATVALAEVRLDKHTIRAPFSGISGIRRVSPGAYITAGQPIVNLEKIDTLKIDFKLPEIYLSQVSRGQEIEIAVDALPKRAFTGTIYAIDPHLDVNGRALTIRARLENPDLVLRPGLFARIRVKGQIKRDVLVVPEAAIVPRGDEKIVYLVKDGQAVEVKVTLGNRNNGMVEVLEGLTEAATVVTAGQQKLRDGGRVEVVTGRKTTGDPGSAPVTSPGTRGS